MVPTYPESCSSFGEEMVELSSPQNVRVVVVVRDARQNLNFLYMGWLSASSLRAVEGGRGGEWIKSWALAST